MPNTPLRSALVDQLTTKLLDFHRRRITNAADAVAPQDYVTLAQVDNLIAESNRAANITNITSTSPFLTPEQFGANGIGNDTSAWSMCLGEAMATGKPIFASGEYFVSAQGSAILPWDGISHPYVFKLTAAVTILGNPKFRVNITDGALANIFLFQQVNGVRISGMKATGLGAASSLIIYEGAMLVFDRCYDAIVYQPSTSNMRGNTLFFQGYDSHVISGFSSIPTTNFAGSHVASYGCSKVTIDKCTTYGGTHDGDIVHFGTNTDDLATANRVMNCRVHNYAYGDDVAKTIVFDEAQGILLDSGQQFGLVECCYVYGHFYGIDIKTTGEGNVANSNTIEKCKVGIAVRRGEGNAPTYNTYLNNNIIRPMGGNGNTQNLFNSLTDTVGYYFEDAIGVTLDGGTVEASYLFPGGGEQDYIPIYGKRTLVPILDSVNDGILISRVKFMNEMNVGGNYTYTRNVSIIIEGFSYEGTVDTSGTTVTRVSGPLFVTGSSWNAGPIWIGENLYFISSVTNANTLVLSTSAGVQTGVASRVSNRILKGGLVDCDFKMFSDFATDDMLGIPVQISGADQFTVDGCHFSKLNGEFQLMTFTNVEKLAISKCTSPGAPGYIDLNSCGDVTIDRCQFSQSGRNLTTALPVPMIYANGVNSLIVDGIRHSQGASLDNGRLVQSSGSGNGDLTISNCQVQFTIFIVDWYAWNGTSNSTAANVSQSGNLVNSVGQPGNDFSGLTASRPLKLNASKNPISAKIDGSASDDFAAGVAAGLLASTGVSGVLTDGTAAMIATLLGVSTTELGYLSGVSSGIQAQLSGIAASISTLQTDVLNLSNNKADHGTYGVTAVPDVTI